MIKIENKSELAALIADWFYSHLYSKGVYTYLRSRMGMTEGAFQPIYQALLEGGVFEKMSATAIANDLADVPTISRDRMEKLARGLIDALDDAKAESDADVPSVGVFDTAEVFTPTYLLTYADAGLALAILESMAAGRKIAHMSGDTPFVKWVEANPDMFPTEGNLAERKAKFERAKIIFKALLMGRSYVFQDGKAAMPGRPTREGLEMRFRRSSDGDRYMRMHIARMMRDIKFPEPVADND